MKARKIIASLLSVMTVMTMLPLNAFAYDGNTQQDTNVTVNSDAGKTKLQPSASSEYDSDSGCSSFEQETTALVAYGYCTNEGSDAKWAFYESGTLYIYGTGDMDVSDSRQYNYNNIVDSVKRIVVESGITSIGKEAFSMFNSVASVEIAGSVTTIGESFLRMYAFDRYFNVGWSEKLRIRMLRILQLIDKYHTSRWIGIYQQ